MNYSLTLPEDTAYIAWARQLSFSTIFYVCTIIFPIGVILNIIEIIIFQREKFSKSTMGFFLSIYSSLHIIILIYVTAFNFPSLYRINLTTWSDLTCKAYVFFLRSLYQAYSWLNVIIVGDRLLFIFYPNKFKFQKNKLKISFMLLGFLLFVFACNSPNLLYFVSVRINNSTNVTTFSRTCTAVPIVLTVRGLMTIIFRTVLPFILMFFMNILLIYKVIKSKEKMRLKKKLIHDLKFSFTVIFTTILFLITLIPNSVYVFMAFVFQADTSITRRQTYSAFLFLFEIMTSLVYFLFYSFNIFIQFAFNSIFKNECLRIIANSLKGLNSYIQEENSTSRSKVSTNKSQ